MTTQDTKVDNLIINKLTKQQYAQITPNENEIYLVEDDFNPDALSDLAYSGSFSDLLNKPTTLSGYGITNAYTKTEVDNKLTSTYKAAGSASSVSNLGTLDASHEGFVYNMTADFTTTSDFVEGAGKQHYAGANVAIVNTGTTASPVYKYDILGDFIDLSGYQLSNTAVTHTASTSVGDSTTPVYINSNGVATALSYTIAKSVPADALFTDTVYTHPTDAGNKHIPSGGSAGQVLAYGGSSGTATWTTLTIPDAQIQSDWNQTNTSAKDYIKNKPTIPAGVVVDQTYDGTSTNAQSGVAIDGAGFVQNTATGTNSLTILGNPTNSSSSINIGDTAYAVGDNAISLGRFAYSGESSISIGNLSSATGEYSIAIGYNALIGQNTTGAIQLGYGTNNNDDTFCVGLGSDNYCLLNSFGIIPSERINTDIARTADIPDISTKQDTLVSGTNIKTINSTSLLGSGNINVLQNTATAGHSLTIGGSATTKTYATNIGLETSVSGNYGTAIGTGATATSYATGVGQGSMASGSYSIAIGQGSYCSSTASGSIQIGKGTNSTASSLFVGFPNISNYQLLDGTTGLIPDARISSNIARTSAIPTITDTYSGTSSDGMSGKAVKSAIDTAISSVYKPKGSITFASRPTLSASVLGNVYNITDAFTTTSDFVEGASKSYPAGTNIVVINTGTDQSPIYKFDVLSGVVDLSGYVPTSRTVNSKALSSNITLNGSDLALTGYSKASSVSAVAATDSINTAIGKVEKALDGKQATLTSGTNIKTINSTSILGSGNISVEESFIAEYNTATPSSSTSFSDIKTAYEAGKRVYCNVVGANINANIGIVPLVWVGYNVGTITEFKFGKIENKETTFLSVNNLNSWSYSTDTLATTSQIPDISTKQDTLVSGTNIKTINSTSILGSGNIDISEVFIATYNVTSFADIQTAYNAGKAVFCKGNNFTYLFSLNSSLATFFSFGASANALIFKCTSSSVWSYETYYAEQTSNKVTSISSSSTNTQYPSAKCVYDALADKANKDLSNLSATGESKLISLQIIDYSE